MMTTSDWGVLGNDRIPRWPSKIGEKRKIRVDISSWIGTSPGAKHTYASVVEENNQWWSESENTWVEIYSDSSKSGYSAKGDLMTEVEAVAFALFCVELIAGKKRLHHKVLWSGPSRPKWAERGAF